MTPVEAREAALAPAPVAATIRRVCVSFLGINRERVRDLLEVNEKPGQTGHEKLRVRQTTASDGTGNRKFCVQGLSSLVSRLVS